MKKIIPILVLPALSTMVLLQSLAAEFATTKAQARDDWWMARHQQKLQEVATSADEIDLVFIGDSITHFMDDRAPGLVERTFPEMKHLNLGYSADRTENVLWRLQNGEIAGLSPKVVVLMIGTNNTGHRRDPFEVTLGGIRLIVEELRKQLPEAKVLLLSIFPRGETAEDPLRRLNESINSQLPRLADGRFVFHLDINEAFLNEDSRLPEAVMPDLLHPNQKGYEIWLAEIQPKVQEILAMEQLPTPPEIWAEFDPDAGDYKEEIVREETRDGVYSNAHELGLKWTNPHPPHPPRSFEVKDHLVSKYFRDLVDTLYEDNDKPVPSVNVVLFLAGDEVFDANAKTLLDKYVRFFRGKNRVIRGENEIKGARSSKETQN